MSGNDAGTPPNQPFVAPCYKIKWNASFRWLKMGWRDFRRTPKQSLSYGLLMLTVSYAISLSALHLGNLGLYLGLISGFVFLGPPVAMTLYAISNRLENNKPPSLKASVNDAKQAIGDALVFILTLLIIFLLWARAATMVYIFFPAGEDAPMEDLLVFLAVGSGVGAIFCAAIFLGSAFSLPMILDRSTDTVTAIVTSINAVLRNKLPLFIWAICIGMILLAGILTFYLALTILLPVLGYASWHAYRETIDPRGWPKRPFSDKDNSPEIS